MMKERVHLTKNQSIAIALFAVVVCVLLLGIHLGVKNSPSTSNLAQQQAEERQTRRQNLANEVVNSAVHIRDPRTGLCFTYYWLNGRPVLMCVPCDSIPPELLFTAEIK